MAANDIAIEYTENTYSSRNEMSRDIGFQVSEMMWRKVTDYRSSFNKIVPLRWINSTQPVLCVYPGLSVKLKRLSEKINNLIDQFEISDNEQEFERFVKCGKEKVINSLTKYEKILINKEQLEKLLINENPYDEKEDLILNYLKCIDFINNNKNNELDSNYFTSLYSCLIGGEVLSSYVRQNDITHINRMAIVGRVYEEVAPESIVQMMNSLYDFLANDSFNPYEKAFVSLYYTILVKPFKKYPLEYATLIFKAVLSHYGYETVVAYLPIEEIVFNSFKEFNKANLEVQQFNDFTYFVAKIFAYFEPIIDATVNDSKEIKISEIKEDFFKEDINDNKEEHEHFNDRVEEFYHDTINVNDSKSCEEIVEEDDNPIEYEIISEEKNNNHKENDILDNSLIEDNTKPDSEDTIIENETPDETNIVVDSKTNNAKTQYVSKETREEVDCVEEEKKTVTETTPNGIAISFKLVALNEKQAQMLEDQILGTDVLIKKKEAKFYARHCSLGVYYTIEQYKKATKCVYETARTSMEHLVQLGYYSKKQVGKKFVYTPIERK